MYNNLLFTFLSDGLAQSEMSEDSLLQIRLDHPVTYLSPNVHHILCEVESSEESSRICLCLNCDGVIGWDSLETFLPGLFQKNAVNSNVDNGAQSRFDGVGVSLSDWRTLEPYY